MDMKTELEKTTKQIAETAAYIQQAQQSVNAHQVRLCELQGVVRFLQDQLNPKPKADTSKDKNKVKR